MVKLKTTITFEYDANPEYYDTDNPEEMAKIDEENYNDNPFALLEILSNKEFDVEVEVA